MNKKLQHFAILLLIFSCNSCCFTSLKIYNLSRYKINSQPYIPIYNKYDPEWIKVERLIKKEIAPAKWGNKCNTFSGFEYKLYIKTSKKNHRKIKKALPTFWKPETK